MKKQGLTRHHRYPRKRDGPVVPAAPVPVVAAPLPPQTPLPHLILRLPPLVPHPPLPPPSPGRSLSQSLAPRKNPHLCNDDLEVPGNQSIPCEIPDPSATLQQIEEKHPQQHHLTTGEIGTVTEIATEKETGIESETEIGILGEADAHVAGLL